MPVADQCSFEFDAAIEAADEAAEICSEADVALSNLVDALEQNRQDCEIDAGPEPPEITPDMEAPLVHELERKWDEYRESVRECVNSAPPPEDLYNEYEDLRVACEIALEEADAIRDELEVCLHALNEGIPFA